MTDKELLGYSAKAAGIRLEWIGNASFDCTTLKLSVPVGEGSLWMPLHDDGDALRLSVKCGISIGPDYDGVATVAFYRDSRDFHESNVPDAYAATRRAITRAAAEIGKAMQ